MISDRLTARWLTDPPLAALFAAFEAAGSEARVVGGAVRNALLGEAVNDIDLATPLEPGAVIELAHANGFAAHPTGLAHGTITLLAHGRSFEVTTLRRDVETDGRRAVVAFTRDWAEDALRRDFTINALYARADGTLDDYAGGLDDLAHRRVRFIGDARTRIREDYLRILRLFRFSAIYAAGTIDAEALSAAIDLRQGLAHLSAERIGAELLKLMAAPDARAIAKCAAVMRDTEIAATLFDRPVFPERLERLAALEDTHLIAADALTRLAVLTIDQPQDAAYWAERLRLSSAVRTALAATHPADDAIAGLNSDAAIRAALYRSGAINVRRAWLRSAAAGAEMENAARIVDLATTWPPPSMPVSGADVLALGVVPGPKVGEILEHFESWWIAEDFPDDRATIAAALSDTARSLLKKPSEHG